MHLILVFCLGLLTSGCVAVVVAGAAVGMVVYDKRSVTVLESDARIYHVISKQITKDPRFQSSHIVVVSFNQVVLLLGETPSALLRVFAEKVAQKTSGVRRIHNEIQLTHPISLSTKTKDGLITTQVRASMLNQKGLESGSIRVVTEAGVVYLMGIVTHEQAHLAVAVARQVKDVQKVVKVFQYIV